MLSKLRLSRILLIGMLLLQLFATVVLANFTTEIKEKHLPYDDNNKYTYFVKGLEGQYDQGKLTYDYEVHVRDAETHKVLSLDTYTVTVTGLSEWGEELSTPYNFHIGTDKHGTENYLDSPVRSNNGVYIDKVITYHEGDWDAFKQHFEETNMDDDYEIIETTFGEYKALLEVYTPEDQLDLTGSFFHILRVEKYYLYLEDVVIPEGICVMSLSGSARTSGEMGLDHNQGDGAVVIDVRGEMVDHVVTHAAIDQANMHENLTNNGSAVVKTSVVASIRTYEDQKNKFNISINTKASDVAGETGVTIPSIIITGVLATTVALGAAAVSSAAIGGASAAGVTSKGNDSGTDGRCYEMRVSKNFGDSLKYGGDAEGLFARIVEIGPDGGELDRDDLTALIGFSSEDGQIEVINKGASAGYMFAEVTPMAQSGEGIVTIAFNGPHGHFSNHMTFNILGEVSVVVKTKTPSQQYMLVGSGLTLALPIILENFVTEPVIRLGTVTNDAPMTLTIEKALDGSPILKVVDQSIHPDQIEQFYESYGVEIIAENEDEIATYNLQMVFCYEGLLATMLGDTEGICGYLNKESGLMATSSLKFQLGLWSEEEATLLFHQPEDLAFTYSDENRITDTIGLSAEVDVDWKDEESIVYLMRGEKPYPDDAPCPGDFMAMCRLGDKTYEYSKVIPLIPDRLLFEENASREEEYQNCLYMINAYLPDDKKDKLIEDLEEKKDLYQYGAKDYQAYRHYVWQRAQHYLFNEHRDYMKAAEFYDDMLVICEWTAWVGDIALNFALMPFGGPLASFAISNGKNLLVAVTDVYITKGTVETKDVVAYLTGVLGNLDGVVSTTPSPSDLKKLALWLSAFFCYRVIYHRCFSKDGTGKPIDSWVDAITMGFKDLAVKSLLAGFGGLMMGDAADSTSVKAGGRSATYHKGADDKIMKPLTDIGDNVIEGVNSQLDIWLSMLYQFLDDVVDGKASIPKLT